MSASESLDDLREAERLVRANWLTATSVEAGARVAALVTSGLGRLPRWFVTSLPFGYEGSQIDHRGTVNRDDVIRATAQLVGLVHPNRRAEAVAVQASKAVADAVDLHFLENIRYDAWRPGMPSGSGWCDAVTVTEYGLSKVRCPVEADEEETAPEPLITSLPTEQLGSAVTSAGIEAARTAIKAGEAFAAAMESNPENKAAWERTRAKLQAFGEAMRQMMNSPEYRAAKEAERRRWQDLADSIRANVQWAGDKLEARHFPRPESIEDWEHLAQIVEMPFETIRRGDFTAREVFAVALAWADRQRIKAKLEASANPPTPTKSPANGKPELRSWTQTELDNAIRQHKAERATSYADLCDAVKKNKAGAKKKAREIYGRNAIARALGVKAKAMVSKSPAWIAIAQDLGLPLNRNRRAQGTRHTQRPGRVGHEIAVEEKSAKPEEGADNAPAEEQLETVERQETIRRINALARAGKTAKEKADNQKAADALIQKLQRGECTDDQARQVVDMSLNPNG